MAFCVFILINIKLVRLEHTKLLLGTTKAQKTGIFQNMYITKQIFIK